MVRAEIVILLVWIAWLGLLKLSLNLFTSLLILPRLLDCLILLSSCLKWILLVYWFVDVPIKVIHQIVTMHRQDVLVNSSCFTFRFVLWSNLVNNRVIANTRCNNLDLLFPVTSYLVCSPSLISYISTLYPQILVLSGMVV